MPTRLIPCRLITHPIILYLLLPHILLPSFLSFNLIFPSSHPPNFTYPSAIGQLCIESPPSLPSSSPSCTYSFSYSSIPLSLNRFHSCHCDHQKHAHVCCCLSPFVVPLYTSCSESQRAPTRISLPPGIFTLPPVCGISIGSLKRLLTSF